MRYVDDTEIIKKRHAAFWEQEIIDRCCVAVTAEKSSAEPLQQQPEEPMEYWFNPELILQRNRMQLGNTIFKGDALPRIWVNLGPGITAAYLGSRVHPRKDTVWFEPFVQNWVTDNYTFDPESVWWKKTKQITSYLTDKCKDECIVSITDLSGVADIMAHLRGTENLCLDLIETPEAVKQVRDYILKVWHNCFEELYQITQKGSQGSTCWLDLWAPGRQMILQCDFSTLLSPFMFEEFFLPEIEEQSRSIEYPIYHLDGPDEIRHLDALLSIAELKAVQWVPNPGEGQVNRWLSMFKKIQKAGKSIYFAVAPWYNTDWHDIAYALEELSPEGLFIDAVCSSEEEADWIEQQLPKWSYKKTYY